MRKVVATIDKALCSQIKKKCSLLRQQRHCTLPAPRFSASIAQRLRETSQASFMAINTACVVLNDEGNAVAPCAECNIMERKFTISGNLREWNHRIQFNLFEFVLLPGTVARLSRGHSCLSQRLWVQETALRTLIIGMTEPLPKVQKPFRSGARLSCCASTNECQAR